MHELIALQFSLIFKKIQITDCTISHFLVIIFSLSHVPRYPYIKILDAFANFPMKTFRIIPWIFECHGCVFKFWIILCKMQVERKSIILKMDLLFFLDMITQIFIYGAITNQNANSQKDYFLLLSFSSLRWFSMSSKAILEI